MALVRFHTWEPGPATLHMRYLEEGIYALEGVGGPPDSPGHWWLAFLPALIGRKFRAEVAVVLDEAPGRQLREITVWRDD